MSRRVLLPALIILLGTAAGAAADTTWVAVAAHNAGLEDSLWQTDLGVLNTCAVDATVEITLHTEDGDLTESFVIAGGQQQVFQDVVAQLTEGEASGALEISSDVPVSITSRTYNVADTGTFGQSLAGVVAEDGLDTGDTVFLQQLRQDADFRTNLGLLNMGAEALAAEVTLYDLLGAEVGTFEMQVPTGQTVQDTRPYLQRFGRSDIVGGYARVTVTAGSGAWAYASVVDGRTNDPTTITATAAPDCPLDIADALATIEGMTVVESSVDLPGYRYFILLFDQPADHHDPEGPTFRQYLTFLHRSSDAPTVFHTAGYNNSVTTRRMELTQMLNANQLSAEHRFFNLSVPSPIDWSLLDIEQAANDHHRIVEAIRPFYSGAWITTGGSKGGMTAIFHRRFFPDDVDASVPYVAPISYGVPDERYIDFLATRGTPECRQGLVDVQREALGRRATMLPMFESWAEAGGYTFDRIGGAERAFESAVTELPFTFWQYAGENFCSFIPDTGASDGEIFEFLGTFSSFWYPSDASMDYFAPYFYQAHTELGYPDLDWSHLDDLLVTEPLNLEEGLPPEGVTTTFDPQPMLDVADWVATEGSRLLFIYGENDPYTAGAFELGNAEDSYIFTVAGGTHGAGIHALTAADQDQIRDILERWTGVTPTTSQGSPPPSRPPKM